MVKMTKNAKRQFKLAITGKRGQKIASLSATYSSTEKDAGSKLWIFLALASAIAIGG